MPDNQLIARPSLWPSDPLDRDLVGEWRCELTAGNKVPNSALSGYGPIHGTFWGATTVRTFTRYGPGILFPNLADKVHIGQLPDNVWDQLTVEVAFYFTSDGNWNGAGAWAHFAPFDWPNQLSYWTGFSNGQEWHFRIVTGAPGIGTDGNLFALAAGPALVHLIATYDGAFIREYYNAIERGAPVAKTGNFRATANEMYMGEGGNQLRTNPLHLCRIYKRALNLREVQQRYEIVTARASGLAQAWQVPWFTAPVGGPPPITIICTTGALAIAGHGATVVPGAVTVACNVGALASTGHAATVYSGVTVPCTVGALAIAGQAATVVPGAVTVACNVGALVIAGHAATIALGAITITCTVGALAIAGHAATVVLGTNFIACTVGALAIAGQTATVVCPALPPIVPLAPDWVPDVSERLFGAQYEIWVYAPPPNPSLPRYTVRGIVYPSIFKWCMRYRIAVNGPYGSPVPSSFTATMDANDERAAWFERNAFLRVRRKPRGGEWRDEEAYIVRRWEIDESATSRKLTIGAWGLGWLAQKAEVVPLATDTDGYSRKSGPADTVMKEYVTEQMGAGAVPPERQCPGLILAAPTGLGFEVSEGARYGNRLFDVLYRCARAGGLDFWFEFDPPDTIRFMTGQIGTDRTERTNRPLGLPFQLFTPDRHNMIDVHRVEDWYDIGGTMVYVLGAGQGAEQEVYPWPATGHLGQPGYWDRMEMSVSEPKIEYNDVPALQAAGGRALIERGPIRALQFKARQVHGSQEGIDYFPGDYVTARYYGWLAEYRVKAIERWLSDSGDETTETELEVSTVLC